MSTKMPLSSFHVGQLLLGMGLSLIVVNISSEIPLEKTDAYLVSRCYLEIASWFGMGNSVHLTLSVLVLHLTLICASPVPAATVSPSFYACWSGCVWEILLPWYHLSQALTLFLPSLCHSTLRSNGGV